MQKMKLEDIDIELLKKLIEEDALRDIRHKDRVRNFIWFRKENPESSVRGMNFPINNLNQTYNI